jgi:hypothetical protein
MKKSVFNFDKQLAAAEQATLGEQFIAPKAVAPASAPNKTVDATARMTVSLPASELAAAEALRAGVRVPVPAMSVIVRAALLALQALPDEQRRALVQDVSGK